MNLSSKKLVRLSLLVLILLILGYGLWYGLRYAYLGSSYAAKITCSCVFVSGRDSAAIRSEDLYAVPFATTRIDRAGQSVTASIYGLAEVKAIYREGLGCTLLNDITEEALRQQPGISPAGVLAATPLPVGPMPAEIDSTALKQAIQEVFAEPDPANPVRSRAVVVLYKGQIIAEQYAPGISPETRLTGWSMTKSVTNALIGIMVKDGKLTITKPAPIVEWQQDERRNITIDHLLRMSSGLAFQEDYSQPGDATDMLFRSTGAGLFALKSKARTATDQVWSYSSGTTNILQEIIRRQFPDLASYRAFPHQRLFRKIGMSSAVLEPDPSGTYVGSSFMYASARDWARFGQLYLQDGIWQGERILPEGWVTYSATETPHSDGQYAAQFWLNHKDKSFPQDAFMAMGFEGQSVTIVPASQLVIVRLGCTSGEKGFDQAGFVKKVVAAVKKPGALTP